MWTRQLTLLGVFLCCGIFASGCVTIQVGDGENQSPQAASPANSQPAQTQPEPQDKESDEHQITTMAQVKQACDNIHQSRDISLGCAFQRLEGVMTLAIGFPNYDEMDTYLDAVAEVLVGPFCAIALTNYHEAAVVVALTEEQVGRLYGCESEEASEWFDLSEEAGHSPAL